LHDDLISFSRDMSQTVEKMPYLAMLEESFKKFLDLDPEVDDFQNSTSSS